MNVRKWTFVVFGPQGLSASHPKSRSLPGRFGFVSSATRVSIAVSLIDSLNRCSGFCIWPLPSAVRSIHQLDLHLFVEVFCMM